MKTTRGGVEYGIGAIPLGGYVKIPGMHRPAPGDLRASLPRPEARSCARAGSTRSTRRSSAATSDGARRGARRSSSPTLGTQPHVRGARRTALAPDAYWRQRAWKRVVVIAAGPVDERRLRPRALRGRLHAPAPRASTRGVAERARRATRRSTAGLQRRRRDRARSPASASTPTTIPAAINATRGRPFTIVVDRHGRRVDDRPAAGAQASTAASTGSASRSRPSTAPASRSPQRARELARPDRRRSPRARSAASASSSTARARATSRARSGSCATPRQAYRVSIWDFLFLVGVRQPRARRSSNLLPLLPLDGGHIVMSVLERVRGRAFSQLVYMRYSAVGLALFVVPALPRPPQRPRFRLERWLRFGRGQRALRQRRRGPDRRRRALSSSSR